MYHTRSRYCQELSKPKVCDDHVALPVKEDVLRLEVSVDNIEGVEVGEGTDKFSREEQGC